MTNSKLVLLMLGTAILIMFPSAVCSSNPETEPFDESRNDSPSIDKRDLADVEEEVVAEKAASIGGYGGGYGDDGIGGGYGGVGYGGGGYGGGRDRY